MFMCWASQYWTFGTFIWTAQNSLIAQASAGLDNTTETLDLHKHQSGVRLAEADLFSSQMLFY